VDFVWANELQYFLQDQALLAKFRVVNRLRNVDQVTDPSFLRRAFFGLHQAFPYIFQPLYLEQYLMPSEFPEFL